MTTLPDWAMAEFEKKFGEKPICAGQADLDEWLSAREAFTLCYTLMQSRQAAVDRAYTNECADVDNLVAKLTTLDVNQFRSEGGNLLAQKIINKVNESNAADREAAKDEQARHDAARVCHGCEFALRFYRPSAFKEPT